MVRRILGELMVFDSGGKMSFPFSPFTAFRRKELFAAAHELRNKIMPRARTVHKAILTSDLFKSLDMAIEMETEAVAFYSGLASDITS
jgi:rubrerythrin